ncbi:hypothetical protein FRC11_014295 [Ceratobasidium sp. 423]|nr:hypothetical protein FRC11_014295 [Ceratobasidium sp. 423]
MASLWSHIDLFQDQFCDPISSTRLQTYATRSAQALLDVHIIDDPVAVNPGGGGTVFPFLTAVAPRIRSLTIESACGPYSAFCNTALATCVENCIPGVFTEVSIDCFHPPDADPVIYTRTSDGGLAQPNLESLWLNVKILRLDPSLVEWPSKTYHGLTELRLTFGAICKSVLISIFHSNPQLRVLELNVDLEDPLPENISPTPVHLDNLEILVVQTRFGDELSSILRLIAPGPRALSLSIRNPYDHDVEFPSKAALRDFVARSNIKRFNAVYFDTYLQLAEILSLIPTVRELALSYFKCDFIDEESSLPPGFTLDAVYVLWSANHISFTWPSLEKFVKKHGVWQLTLYEYNFQHCGIDRPGEERVPDNMYTVCPVVNVLPGREPYPIEEWY